MAIFDQIILFGWYFPQKHLLRAFENSLSLLSEEEILKGGEFLLSPSACL